MCQISGRNVYTIGLVSEFELYHFSYKTFLILLELPIVYIMIGLKSRWKTYSKKKVLSPVHKKGVVTMDRRWSTNKVWLFILNSYAFMLKFNETGGCGYWRTIHNSTIPGTYLALPNKTHYWYSLRSQFKLPSRLAPRETRIWTRPKHL